METRDNNTLPVITVIGTGYVGLTTAVLFAHAGYKVYALDTDEKKVKTILSGKSFFYEHGINQLIPSVIDSGNLVPTTSYEASIPHSDYVFSCVGTPDGIDGKINLAFIHDAFERTVSLAKDDVTYIQKSTVPVGTGRKLSELIQSSGKNISYVSNPEFLREGNAISDTIFPDRVVVGGDIAESLNEVINIYRDLLNCSEQIALTAKVQSKPLKHNFMKMGLESAELTKVTANAFLATKITFANSIAMMADIYGADVKEVMGAVGEDPRIGKAFLNAGRGYGGGCFPKDVKGLIGSSEEVGLSMDILRAVSSVNDAMPDYIISKFLKFSDEKAISRVCVLGLAFKAGTSDARKSPGVQIANKLASQGFSVSAYDPEANDEAAPDLSGDVALCQSASKAIQNSDAIFITTDWDEFLELDFRSVASAMEGTVVVDCMNAFDPENIRAAGLTYIGVGR